MKIEGPKSSSELNKKKSVKNATGDGTFGAMVDAAGDGADEATGASLSSNIAGVDALLIAQAAEDSTEKQSRQRMKQRAGDILEKLQDLKTAIVMGNVTVGHMISIADVIATHRESVSDPELSVILDEIDLRAHVELAKLEVAKTKLI